MQIVIVPDRLHMGRWVADRAAAELTRVIAEHGEARLLIATGASQFEVLDSLSQHHEVDWNKVSGFHLDEYIGLASNHPASFCGYLAARFVDRVPQKQFHYLRGDSDPVLTIQAASKAINDLSTVRATSDVAPIDVAPIDVAPIDVAPIDVAPIDVALVGIGENGHLAFNDPPADFDCNDPYIIVKLDEACRKQQVGEGWFADMSQVPTHAISMSIRQIMKSAKIFCSVPDERKAAAVKNSVEGLVTRDVPASILQQHPAATLIIDRAAASLLSPATLEIAESL